MCLGAGTSAAAAAAGQPAAAAAAEGRLAELAGQFRPLGRHIIVLAFFNCLIPVLQAVLLYLLYLLTVIAVPTHGVLT